MSVVNQHVKCTSQSPTHTCNCVVKFCLYYLHECLHVHRPKVVFLDFSISLRLLQRNILLELLIRLLYSLPLNGYNFLFFTSLLLSWKIKPPPARTSHRSCFFSSLVFSWGFPRLFYKLRHFDVLYPSRA